MDENGKLQIYAIPAGKFITDLSMTVIDNNGDTKSAPYAAVNKKDRTLTMYPKTGDFYYEGYGIMLLFVHELAHLSEIENGTLSDDVHERERAADKLVENHWVYNKVSNRVIGYLEKHKEQEKGK